MVAATASRVSAWVNATAPASGSSTRPASRAGCEQVVDLVDGSLGDRGEHVERAAPAEHRGEQQQRPGLARAAPRAAGRPRRGRSPARASVGAGSAPEPGELDQEERVAARSGRATRRRRRGRVPAGHLRDQRRRPRRRSGRRGRAGRTCRRASSSPTSASAPVGSGHGRRVATTASRWPGAVEATQVAQHPQAGGVGPVQVLEHDQERGCLGAASSTSRAMLSQARNACRSALSRRRPRVSASR